MFTNKLLLGAFIFLFPMISWAQSEDLFMPGSRNDMMYQALKDGFYIVESEYVMASRTNKNKEYGRDGKSYYDRIYTISPVIDKRLWLSVNAYEPWLLDNSIESLKDTLVPVLSRVAYRPLKGGDTKMKEVKDLTKEIKEDTKVAAKYLVSTEAGFKAISMETKPKTGFVLVFYRNPTDDSLVVQKTIQKVASVDWTDPSNPKPSLDIEKHIGEDMQVLGGVLLMEQISFGKIEFKVQGLYTQNLKTKDTWAFRGLIATKEESPSGGGAPTPIKPKK